MKSIIMTAQDAREFEKLGGLTITKPIKPAQTFGEGVSVFYGEEDGSDDKIVSPQIFNRDFRITLAILA